MSAQEPEELQLITEHLIPTTAQPVADPWHAENRLRGYVTISVLCLVGLVVLVLAEQTLVGKLSPQEFAEIAGPIVVGLATGVVGYLFSKEPERTWLQTRAPIERSHWSR